MAGVLWGRALDPVSVERADAREHADHLRVRLLRVIHDAGLGREVGRQPFALRARTRLQTVVAAALSLANLLRRDTAQCTMLAVTNSLKLGFPPIDPHTASNKLRSDHTGAALHHFQAAGKICPTSVRFSTSSCVLNWSTLTPADAAAST